MGFLSGAPEVQDLKEYFRRPRLIQSGTLSASASPLFNFDITKDSLFTDVFPTGLERLEGVEGVRFKMVFTVTVAATPFHGGVVALAYQYGSSIFDPDQFCRVTLTPACTNLPHVRLNVAEETMVQLSIPFLFDLDYIPLDISQAGNRKYGALGLLQIVPTPTLTTSGPPTFKCFAHLEDLELIGARPSAFQLITAQSGLHTVQPSGAASLLAEARENKLISRGLSAASKIVSSVGAAVPSFLPISGPTSWALRMMSGVASVFGYSKPRDATKPARHQRTDYIGEMNVDMPSNAFALAATAENTLRIDNTLSATNDDEMSLKFITSKYSQICLTSLSTSDTMGTRIWGTTTCLMNFWYRLGLTKPFCNLDPPISGVDSNCLMPSGLMYWSNFFRLWRGSLKFRFTFGKCKLHAGRVIVGFVPFPLQRARNGPNNRNIPALEVDPVSSFPQPFSYSAVFDLKDASTFEFEVPYISPFLWTYSDGYTGGITMTVLDPLISSGESSTLVPVLVEVAGGDDFEFAVPTSNSMAPCSGNTGLNVYTQSGLGVASDRRVEEYTTGEAILSAKQLLMIPSSTLFTVGNLQEQVTSLPTFAYTPRWTNAIPMADPSQEYFALSRQAGIAACYAYWQGSTSYDVYCDAENDRFVMQALHVPGDGGFVSGAPRSVFSGGVRNNSIRATTSKNALHFQVPSYGYNARLAVRDQYSFQLGTRKYAPGASTLASTVASTVAQLRIRNTTGRDIGVNLSISGGEDARFGTYLGPPLVYLFNSTQTVSPELGSQVI